MCERRPGTRCAKETRPAAARALRAYERRHPDGPPVTPLAAVTRKPSAICDTGAELRLVTEPGGGVTVEQLEFIPEAEAWLPGPSLSLDASADLGAWLADPHAHTSERTSRTRKWDPEWRDGELRFTCHNGTFSASTVDGDEARFIADLSDRQASRMSVWLLRRLKPEPPVAA